MGDGLFAGERLYDLNLRLDERGFRMQPSLP